MATGLEKSGNFMKKSGILWKSLEFYEKSEGHGKVREFYEKSGILWKSLEFYEKSECHGKVREFYGNWI